MPLEENRIRQERNFHNARILNGSQNRSGQTAFYIAIRDCLETFNTTVRQLSVGKDILEYGCFAGNNAIRLAAAAHTVTGIDISDLAIRQASEEAKRQHLDNIRFFAMNAEALEFKDHTFDLVFGTGILHHLHLEKAYTEINRVLRPGGHALFVEPFGHNPLINAYRKRTPHARTRDEHPLLWSDLALAGRIFSDCSVKPYGLATLAAVPFRKTPFEGPVLTSLRLVDKLLFTCPALHKYAWAGLLRFDKA